MADDRMANDRSGAGHRDEIIDAEVEPLTPGAAKPRPPKRNSSVVTLSLVVAALVVVVGIVAWWQLGADRIPARNTTAALPAETVTTPPPPSAAEQGVENLNRRLDMLAARPDLAPRVQELEARVVAAEQKAETLERQLAERNRDDPTLSAKVAALEKALAELGEVREQAAARHDAAAVLLAVGQLRDAALSGRPYRAELDALSRLRGAPAIAGALAENAARGVPTPAALFARFGALPVALVNAGDDDEPPTLLERVERWGRRLVTIRPVGEIAGSDTGAIVARAESRVHAGDLAGAVQEVAQLGGPAAVVAADWRADAERRLLIERALGALQSAALARAGETTPRQ